METSCLLAERSLDQLLRQAIDARVEGLVAVRDREGSRHGVWVQRGYVVGVHVAGHYDPLLELLRRAGELSPRAHQQCVAALQDSTLRAGELACSRFAVAPSAVRQALALQLVTRFRVLAELSETSGHDARLERGATPASELSIRMPLGSLLRRAQWTTSDAPDDARHVALTDSPKAAREQARRVLRQLARQLHPDRHAHLDAHERMRLSSELARATAAYHGFS